MNTNHLNSSSNTEPASTSFCTRFRLSILGNVPALGCQMQTRFRISISGPNSNIFFRTRGWIHHTTTLHTSRDSQRLTTHETWNSTLHTFHNDSQRLTTTHSDSQRLTATHNDSQRLTSHKVNLKSLTTHTTHDSYDSRVTCSKRMYMSITRL